VKDWKGEIPPEKVDLLVEEKAMSLSFQA